MDSGIEVKASFFPLSFLLYFFTPQASINGGPPFPVTWKQPVPVPVPAGRYQVEVWLPYLWMSRMGKNGVVIDVPSGSVVRVGWRAPLVIFIQGKIAADAPVPTSQALPYAQGVTPGGWHPDPSGRHEQRYYDGGPWTAHVVDEGVQSTDPLSA